MTETNAAALAAEEQKPAKPKMPEQNGIRQPAPGTVVAAVWDAASAISEKMGHPATRAEVRENLGTRINPATLATQYARWVRFYGVSDRLKQMRNEVQARKQAEKDEASKKREAEKTEKQAKLHAEREERKKIREQAKADKEADKRVKAAEKEAAKKKAEAERAAKAAAAAAPQPGA